MNCKRNKYIILLSWQFMSLEKREINYKINIEFVAIVADQVWDAWSLRGNSLSSALSAYMHILLLQHMFVVLYRKIKE